MRRDFKKIKRRYNPSESFTSYHISEQGGGYVIGVIRALVGLFRGGYLKA